MIRCSQCGCPIEESEKSTFPFCSERCRMLDLGAWLDEQRGLPFEPDDDSMDNIEIVE